MPDWLSTTLLIVSIFLQLVGFLGLFLVFFPGLTVIWIGQITWAFSVGFNQEHLQWQFRWTIAILVFNTLLMIAGSILDNFLMAGSAYKKGAPWWSIGVTWAAMIIGGILLTPIGGMVIALLTLYLLEYSRLKNQKLALESAKSMVMGCGWAVAIRVALAVIMLAAWVVAWVWF